MRTRAAPEVLIVCGPPRHYEVAKRDYDESAFCNRGNGVVRISAGEISLKIAILGTGAVGAALGVRWAQAGHAIAFGSRHPQSERVLEVVELCGTGARAGARA